MSEDWDAIAAEVAVAIAEVGFAATLTRPASESDADAGTPWGDAATGTAPDPDTYTVTVLDSGTTTRYSRADDGALIPRTVRVLTVSTDGEAPQMGDTITISGRAHEISAVSPTAPGGVSLLYDVEVAI